MTARAPCALADLGMVNALGGSLEEIWPRLVDGDQSRLSARDDLILGESRLFGQVRGELPPIPPSLSRYACRNNQLALAAFEAIRESISRQPRYQQSHHQAPRGSQSRWGRHCRLHRK